MIGLPVSADEALVPLHVELPHVPTRGPGEPEDDQLLVVGWRDGEDPFGPVADLAPTPQIDLGRDRTRPESRASRRSSVAHAQSTAARRLGHSSSRRATPSISAGPASSAWMRGDLVEAPLRMARRDHVGGAGLREVLGSELAHRFEEPEAPAERAGLDDQHRPVDQVTEEVVDVDMVETLQIQIRVGHDRCCGEAIERTGEDRQTSEHGLLRWRQQVVRPLDGRPQCPMALDTGPPAAGQQPETIVEPLHQIGRSRGSRCARQPVRWRAGHRRGGGRSPRRRPGWPTDRTSARPPSPAR